jgi:urease accessory protein
VVGRASSQLLTARVARGGTLALAPEPVSPFEGARYEQRQAFELAAGASLLAVDAVVAGRTARGERWALERYRARSEVWIAGRLAVGDALLLAPRAAGELAARLGRFDAFASLLVLGPAFARCARSILDRVGALPVAAGAPLLAAASPLDAGVIVRCAATSAEALGAFVRGAIRAAGDPLGDGAFAHRW